MKKYVGFVSIEREHEEGINAELKTFFSDDINEILKWQESYKAKFEIAISTFNFREVPKVKTWYVENTPETNAMFRPYYDYIALPLKTRQKIGRDARDELERLRHDLS